MSIFELPDPSPCDKYVALSNPFGSGQINIPVISAVTLNSFVEGRYEFSSVITAHARRHWFTADLLNSLLTDTDMDGQVFKYGLGVWDHSKTLITYWGGKCNQITINKFRESQLLRVIMKFDFICCNIFPVGETPIFTFPSEEMDEEGGNRLFLHSAMRLNNTVVDTREWSIDLRYDSIRAFSANAPGSFPVDIVKGRFSGLFSIDRCPRDVMPVRTAQVEIGRPGEGVSFRMALSRSAAGHTYKLYSEKYEKLPLIISDS